MPRPSHPPPFDHPSARKYSYRLLQIITEPTRVEIYMTGIEDEKKAAKKKTFWPPCHNTGAPYAVLPFLLKHNPTTKCRRVIPLVERRQALLISSR
jgi:hypothetical protein